MITLVEECFPVVADSRESRIAQMRAAGDRARALGPETGIDHAYRWDRENSRYVVHAVPFSAPASPWDDEANAPERVRPDWKRSPTRFVAIGDLLTAAADLAGRQWVGTHEHHPSPAQFVRDLQAALDLQYGRGHFWATRHGHRVSVQCRYPLSVAILPEAAVAA